MKHQISIVLPNYNGRKLLQKNLPSILEAASGFEHEIIIVDDCSADDSVAFIEAEYPDINLIVNRHNRGFSATCNRGIFAARHDLLCVVNTDVTFTPDYFSNMIDEFDDAQVFAVKGDIINYVASYDDVMSVDRTTRLYYKRGFLRFDTSDPVTQRGVFSGADQTFVGLGCCFVCNRQMMLELKGFDEIYSPFYWEDSDLARRAMRSGYKLVYLPGSVVYHQASSTIGNYRSNAQRQLISNRNKFLFSWQHLDNRTFWLSHLPTTALNLLLRWLILDWKYYLAFFKAVTRKLTFKR